MFVSQGHVVIFALDTTNFEVVANLTVHDTWILKRERF